MIPRIVILLILFCSVSLTLGKSQCCSGKNILTPRKKCQEGELKQLACEKKYMLNANYSEIIIDDDDNLMFLDTYDDKIPADQYCLTKSEKLKDVLILCFEEEEEMDIMIVNVILSFVSVVFIVLTIGVYLSLPQLLDTQGICLMQSITGLGLSFIILGIINLSRGIPYHNCRLLAYLMYVSFLYAFFWLSILCFHIWKLIVKPKILRCIKHWKLIYHVVGIGGPSLLLTFLLVANYSGHEFFRDIHPGIGESKCWFKNSTTTFIYFYGPISVLLSINIIYFVWTIAVLCQEMKRCSQKRMRILKYRLFLCIKLFFIMGISWCFEVISAVFQNRSNKWIWVLPDCINALQGLLIFLILVVFRKKVLRELANKRIFRSVRLPASWKNAQDDECEELEEELSLSGIIEKKAEIHG